MQATLAFRATLSDGPFKFDGSSSADGNLPLTAARLYAPGPILNISQDGQLSPDFISPGQTNIYRIGCNDVLSALDPNNLALPLVLLAAVL